MRVTGPQSRLRPPATPRPVPGSPAQPCRPGLRPPRGAGRPLPGLPLLLLPLRPQHRCPSQGTGLLGRAEQGSFAPSFRLWRGSGRLCARTPVPLPDVWGVKAISLSSINLTHQLSYVKGLAKNKSRPGVSLIQIWRVSQLIFFGALGLRSPAFGLRPSQAPSARFSASPPQAISLHHPLHLHLALFLLHSELKF